MLRKRKTPACFDTVLPDDEIFIVDSFPIPLCDFKRANASTSPLKSADGTSTLATDGKCATKGLGTFLGFRGSVLTTSYGLPVDFAIATADTDDREVLPLFCERGTYPIIIGAKGMFPRQLRRNFLRLIMCVYYRHGARTKKHNIHQSSVRCIKK